MKPLNLVFIIAIIFFSQNFLIGQATAIIDPNCAPLDVGFNQMSESASPNSWSLQIRKNWGLLNPPGGGPSGPLAEWTVIISGANYTFNESDLQNNTTFDLVTTGTGPYTHTFTSTAAGALNMSGYQNGPDIRLTPGLGGSPSSVSWTLTCAHISACSVTPAVIVADQTICEGETPAILYGDGTNGSTAPSGTANLTHQWQSSTTSTATGFSNIGSATSLTYGPGALNNTTYYRLVTSSDAAADCGDTSNVVTIEVIAKPTPAVITSDQTICEGETPATLYGDGTNGSTAPSGTANLTHQWQSSTTSTATGFSNIGSATSLTYGPGTQNNTTYYRLVTSTDAATNCSDTSNVVTIEVIAKPTPAVITSDQTICEGETPATLYGDGTNGSTAPSGTANLTHQWQSSTTSTISGFSNIGSATSLTYMPAALNDTTYYRLVTSTEAATNCSDTSNVVAVYTVDCSALVMNVTTYDQEISDPCSCEDPENCTQEDVYYFHDTLIITTMPPVSGLNIQVASGTAMDFYTGPGCSGLSLATTDMIPEEGTSGVYKIEFWRPSGQIPELSVTINGGMPQPISSSDFGEACLEEVCFPPPIPTVSQWGIIFLALVLLIFSLISIRQRVVLQ